MMSFKQGHLDGLCGIYSIVHAVSYVNSFTYEESREFFGHVCDDAKTIAPNFVYNGLWFSDLQKLVGRLNGILADHKQVRSAQPFQRKFGNVSEYGQALGSRINQKRACAILSLGVPWNHWTVAHSVAPKSFGLLDSSPGDIPRLRFSHVELKEAPKKTRIHPRQTIIIEAA